MLTPTITVRNNNTESIQKAIQEADSDHNKSALRIIFREKPTSKSLFDDLSTFASKYPRLIIKVEIRDATEEESLPVEMLKVFRNVTRLGLEYGWKANSLEEIISSLSCLRELVLEKGFLKNNSVLPLLTAPKLSILEIFHPFADLDTVLSGRKWSYVYLENIKKATGSYNLDLDTIHYGLCSLEVIKTISRGRARAVHLTDIRKICDLAPLYDMEKIESLRLQELPNFKKLGSMQSAQGLKNLWLQDLNNFSLDNTIKMFSSLTFIELNSCKHVDSSQVKLLRNHTKLKYGHVCVTENGKNFHDLLNLNDITTNKRSSLFYPKDLLDIPSTQR